MGVFKRFLSRPLNICSEKYLAREIKFLINVIYKIIYQQHYFCKGKIDTIKNDKIVKLPWASKLGPKLRKQFSKFGIKTIFASGSNLKNLICRNKSECFLIAFQMFTN